MKEGSGQVLKALVLISTILTAALFAGCGAEQPLAPEPTIAASASSIDFQVGHNIGDRIPGFKIELTDGTPVTAAGLLENNRPAFLFFFATT